MPSKLLRRSVKLRDPLVHKGGRGRPPHVPNDARRQLVTALAAKGLNTVLIAKRLNVTPPTLRRHYAHEIESARLHVRAEMLDVVYHAGISGQTGAAIAWLRQNCGWDLITRRRAGNGKTADGRWKNQEWDPKKGLPPL